MTVLQVGRALAVSLLDLHQLNPWSRLTTTSFGSLAGVKQSLIQRINSIRAKKKWALSDINFLW